MRRWLRIWWRARLRDYFAARAMAAIFVDGQTWTRERSYQDCARRSYAMADAMLEERRK